CCAYSFALSNVVIKRRRIFTKHSRSARFISIFQRALQNSHATAKITRWNVLFRVKNYKKSGNPLPRVN
ncbi:hypothetical protein ACIKQ7_19765, partial [Acinetobacter baumannii]|uniref:hypothetical protein n=1 Tax=Acinetobacter baumannii TaxID=470 RepID=UPI0037D6B681